MSPEEPLDESSVDGISRRRVLKRIGAGMAIAWTAPVLTSLRTPAFAQSPTCQGADCPGPFNPCGPPGSLCLCFNTVSHGGQCILPRFCADVNVCNTDTDCPAGEICLSKDCCPSTGAGTCGLPCGAAGASRAPKGGRTQAG